MAAARSFLRNPSMVLRGLSLAALFCFVTLEKRLKSEIFFAGTDFNGWEYIKENAGAASFVESDWEEAATNNIVWTTKKGAGPRGILLLRATQVPIPKLYQDNFGPKGKPHEKLIMELIASIRYFSPALPVVVVVDEAPQPELLKVIDGYIQMSFDSSKRAWREKIHALVKTPFEETLYLDTDMKVCHDVEPLYDTLNSSEMGLIRSVPQAAAKAANRASYRQDFYGCFVLYKRTARVRELFLKAQTYDIPDQEALNIALFNTQNPLRPPNVYTFPAAASAICRGNDLILPVHGPVYTVHGIDAQCGTINSDLGSRYLRCLTTKDGRGQAGTFEVLNYTNVHGLLQNTTFP